jgi:hypothetical protein
MIVNKVRAVVGRWAGGERERYAATGVALVPATWRVALVGLSGIVAVLQPGESRDSGVRV